MTRKGNDTLLAIVNNTIKQHHIFSSRKVLVALSGGADSVALLRLLLDLGYDCVAAHCNFRLRGQESMRDEVFVRQLCSKLGVNLEVTAFDTKSFAESHGISIEMAARQLRYDFFNTTLEVLA